MNQRSLRRSRLRTLVAPEADLPEDSASHAAPAVAFASLLVVALLLLLLSDYLDQGLDGKKFTHTLIEHGASALVVASVMGLSYEWLLHKRREKIFRRLLGHYRNETLKALQVFMLLTPREVLNLVKDIATQTEKTPTLYEPPREQDGEFVFSTSLEYFDRIVEAARNDVLEVLGTWTDSNSHRNLKFLASDFVGKYRLRELASRLRIQADKKLAKWSEVGECDKGWVLNYFWAASRCEIPAYQSLGRLLVDTDDEYIQQWILFVAQQMQDPELCEVIGDYLANREEDISNQNRKLVIRALAELQRAGVTGAVNILAQFAHLFRSDEAVSEIRRAWLHLNIPKELRSLFSKGGSHSSKPMAAA